MEYVWTAIIIVCFIANVVLHFKIYNLHNRIAKETGNEDLSSCILSLFIFLCYASIILNPVLTAILVYTYLKKKQKLNVISKSPILSEQESIAYNPPQVLSIEPTNNRMEDCTYTNGENALDVTERSVRRLEDFTYTYEGCGVVQYFTQEGLSHCYCRFPQKNNYSFVQKGEPIELSFPSSNEKYELTLDIDGFLVDSTMDSFDAGRPLFTICNDEEAMINYAFPNKLNVCEDEFTKQKCIKGTSFGGHCDGFHFPKLTIKIEFISGKHLLTIEYSSKLITLTKKHSLNVLLDDGTVLHLFNFTNPVKSDHSYERIMMVSTFLTDDDVERLATMPIKKMQIVNIEGVVENEWESEYINDTPKFGTAKKRFISYMQEYTDILSHIEYADNGANESKGVDSSTCFVYLMVDTTNKFHKIGISNNPRYREHTLQSDKPTIELLCAKEFPSRQIALAIETALHNTYGAKRIRGEWFNLDETDVHEIKETLK